MLSIEYSIDIQELSRKAIEMSIEYVPKFIGALLLLLVGLRLIKFVGQAINNAIKSRKMDETLRGFLMTMFSVLLKIMLVISVLGMVGIQVTSFLAFLGAAGIAIGMALSGTLQNFAGGVMLLMFRPFKCGDIIEAMGYSGQVEQIQIFHTVLRAPDTRIIYIPNGPLSSTSLTVFTENGIRRIDFKFSVLSTEDIDNVRNIVIAVSNNYSKVLKTPAASIIVVAPAPGISNFVLRVYVNANDYVPVLGTMYELITKAFVEKNISTPIPLLNVSYISN